MFFLCVPQSVHLPTHPHLNHLSCPQSVWHRLSREAVTPLDPWKCPRLDGFCCCWAESAPNSPQPHPTPQGPSQQHLWGPFAQALRAATPTLLQDRGGQWGDPGTHWIPSADDVTEFQFLWERVWEMPGRWMPAAAGSHSHVSPFHH